MLVKRFEKMWRYNDWAWEHVLKSVAQLPESELVKDRGFFWGSLYGTLTHAVGAEMFWMERLKGNDPKRLFGPEDYPNVQAIIEKRKMVQTEWVAYLKELKEDDAFNFAHYTSTEGEERKSVIADIVQHVCNHSTEHRSQMTPVLFELGVPTDQLDFIFFCNLQEPE